LIIKLSDRGRIQFLKLIFPKKKYFSVRCIENLISILPFILYLGYAEAYLPLVLLVILGFVMVFIASNINFSYTMPTPFNRNLFEYAIGFRKTFYMFLIAYTLAYIAVTVNNSGLCGFAVFLIGLTCFGYYAKLEDEYIVWNFSSSPKEFLRQKAKIALQHFTLLSVPIIIFYCVFFYKNIEMIILPYIACCLYILMALFAKYSNFPKQTNPPNVLIMYISFFFPPLLFLLIPMFYNKSISKLQKVL